MLVYDKEINIVLFSTNSNIKLLAKSDTIFADGTFYRCPKFFTQVFTVQSVQNNIYLPLAFFFFLLPNKSTESYIKVFTTLISECQ